MTNIVPITAKAIRDNGTWPTVTRWGGDGTKVHRTYEGKILVIIEMGMKHGFVFEPGSVVLDYVAAEGSHPRDPREMVMTITGTGRMAAVHELPGGVQDGHGNKQGNSQADTEGEGEGERQALEP